MIPQHMHFFWGNDRLSWLRWLTLYSFRKLHPDWRVTLHRMPDAGLTTKYWDCPNQQDFFAYSGPDYSGQIAALGIEVVPWQWDGAGVGPSHASNFFKWQLLATVGGWYADMDILFVRSLTPYIQRMRDCDAALCCQYGYFSIGLLASQPGNPFFADVLRHAWESYDARIYQVAGVMAVCRAMGYKLDFSGMVDWWGELAARYPGLRFHNFPMELVYPWRCTEMPQVFELCHTHLPEATVGIHWYAGDATSQHFNGRMTADNYRDFPNTLSHFAQQVLELP